MERLTGVVMETTGKHVVLFTPRGEFKKVRITGQMPGIGEEVTISVTHKRFFNMPKASWMAVAAAVILLVIASPLLTMFSQPPEVAVAYVSIDINPSVELTVGSRYHVLDAHAFNSDGEKVLQGLTLNGKKYEDAVITIREKAEELGYLKKTPGNTVVVSVALVPEIKTDSALVGRTLVATANNVFNDTNINLATINVPSNFSEKARQKGISTGKYAVLIEAVTRGVPVTEENIQDKPITVAISEAGGQPEEIIGQAAAEDQFAAKLLKYLDIAENTHPGASVVAANNGQDTPAITAGANNGDAATPGNNTKTGKNKFVESIRNNRSPEDTQTSKGGSVSSTPAIGAPAVGAASPAVPPITDPAVNTGQDGSSPDQVSTAPTDNTSGDTNTSDNYMGSDESGQNQENPDMWKLRPNF